MGHFMIQLQQAITLPGQASYTYGEAIDERGIDAIVEAVNHGFATSGLKTNIGVWTIPIWTTSTTWTQQNATNQDDLDDYNTTIRPSRAEIGGLDPSGGTEAFVLVFEAFGSALDLRISLDGCRNGYAPGAQEAQAMLSFGESTSWQRAVIVVDDSNASAFKTKLEFQWNESGGSDRGELYAATLEEIRYVNLAYEQLPSLKAYGSEWIGAYPEGVVVRAWDEDGASKAFATSSAYAPLMRRDAVAAGVHAAEFDGSNDYLVTEFDPMTLDEGFLLGVAVDQASASDYNWLMDLQSQTGEAVQLRAPTNQIAVFINDGSTYLGGSISDAHAGWMDVLAWYDGADLRLFKNGSEIGSWFIGATSLAEDWRVFLGKRYNNGFHVDGVMAMPIVLDGAFSRRQVERFMQWRRSIHGLY
ncbi:hypothetical protein FIV42_00640 [Persicimonas caeni]|uniref:Uncharacterized protein n=1 Tax=Persicimonas caeni TaxID=2292766 RepID=A0A4Y6PLX1_PERCE|nr:hypothetical protein [Persicimonas caeni]QDG49291.1 hypothetical protein FIV42_00640 [Persicimonas caeni]QED30512.1 hypothetical protein FRD00_00635 [Persicimonas caeni]